MGAEGIMTNRIIWDHLVINTKRSCIVRGVTSIALRLVPLSPKCWSVVCFNQTRPSPKKQTNHLVRTVTTTPKIKCMKNSVKSVRSQYKTRDPKI